MRRFNHPAAEDITLEHVFHALSDPVRLAIVRQLARLGEANCGTLEAGRPKSSMSHHFRVLRDAGVIRTRGEGVENLNSLRSDDLDRRFPGLMAAILRIPPE